MAQSKEIQGMSLEGFKVVRRTLKNLKIQVVFHIFIWVMAVTLEEKGEDTGSEQLVMLIALKRISFPRQEFKILDHEVTGKGQSLPQRQGRMCLAGNFPNYIKGHQKDCYGMQSGQLLFFSAQHPFAICF